jgi:ABC-2 type transport system ATP-binding protein
MMNISVHGVRKQFQSVTAVDDVSFEVPSGGVFGLLGPNGAGKTTLIRMLLDIIRPDSGVISYDGKEIDSAVKDGIGYLPEERGLYRKTRVGDMLEYFAALKGMSRERARRQTLYYLDRLDMTDVIRRKVEELSKGNQQKIQIAAVLVGDPQVIVLDEPFSGLDPLNVRETKAVLREEQAKGKTVLLSTHQMNQAEELCERLVMINQGRRVLYGSIEEIVEHYSESAFMLDGPPLRLPYPGISRIEPQGKLQKVYPQPGTEPRAVVASLLSDGVPVDGFSRAGVSLEEVFVRVAEESSEGASQ